MGYALAIDVTDDLTTWARQPGPGDRGVSADGTVPSAVRLDGDGVLVPATSADLADLAGTSTTGFVAALGSSEPIIVGSTPYGPEALLAVVLRSIHDDAVAATGAAPDATVLLHDDGLDEFRVSFLGEAARLAGFKPDTTTFASRSEADDDDDDRAAAVVAAARLAGGLPAVGSPGAAVAAGAGLAAAAGVTVAAATSDTVAAQGAQGVAGVGPAGTPVGLAGTPVGPAGTPVGPAGTPVGPAGTPVGPAGTPVGPAGTPVGPAGTPGTTAGSGPGAGASGVAATTAKRTIPKWVPVAAVGGVVAVATVVILVVAGGGGDETTAPVITTVAPVEENPGGQPATSPAPDPDATAAPTVAETTTAPTTPAGPIPASVQQALGDIVVSGTVCDFGTPFSLDIDTGDSTLTGVASFTPADTTSGSYQIVYTGEGARLEWTGEYTTSGLDTDAPAIVLGGAGNGIGTVDGLTIELPDDFDQETLQFEADLGATC